MKISDEAVEAAAKAEYEHEFKVANSQWLHATTGEKTIYRDGARAALETVAPLLMHQAWVEGYRVGEVDCFYGQGGDQPAENKSPYHPERRS